MTTRIISGDPIWANSDSTDALTTASGGDSSNGTVTVQTGDVLVAYVKWEEAVGDDPTFSDSAGTIGTWVNSLTPIKNPTVNETCKMGYVICTAGASNITVTATRSGTNNLQYVGLHAEAFRPAGGATLALGTGGEAPVSAGGQFTSPSTNPPNAGTISASAAGFGFCGTGNYDPGTWTATTNWAGYRSPYAFTQYRALSGSASLTGNPTFSASTQWVAYMLYFKESGGSGPAPGAGSAIYTGNSSPMNYTMTPGTA